MKLNTQSLFYNQKLIYILLKKNQTFIGIGGVGSMFVILPDDDTTPASAADVVIYGLNIIMSMMNQELLKVAFLL